MNKRIDYIDALRGFAIFLVTLGHVLENSGYRSDTALHSFIYSFHMPIFMAISGFICAYVNHNRLCLSNAMGGVISFVTKKFSFIMLPYFVWSLLVNPFFFYAWDGTLDWMSSFRAACIDNTSFWFLPCLFGLMVSYAIYKLIREGLKVRNWMIELTIVAFVGILIVVIQKFTHIDFFRSVCSYFLPFWIGVFMGQYQRVYEWMADKLWVYTLALVGFCLLVGLFLGQEGTISKLARLVCGILSIPILFGFFKHWQMPDKVNHVLCYVGKNTLPIYVMQFSFVDGLVKINGLNLFYQIIIFSAVSMLMIAFILLIVRLLERSAILRHVLLGRR